MLLAGFVGTARADYGPSGYDPNNGKGDVVCAGSDTAQYIGDFLADGSPFAHAGFNANGSRHDKLVSIDATGDALARFSYAQTQTVTNLTVSPLDPTVILRAGQVPAQRPNGSGVGYNALINDVTTTAQEKINCVLNSSLPTAQNYADAQNAATGHAWGGLHVVRAATDTVGVAAALTTNAPAGLSDAELVPIYQGVSQTWGDIPGYSGPCSDCSIVPMIPQPGSGLRNTFLADLQQFNGGVPVVLSPNVRQGIEENDPTVITNLNATDEPNAIAPFSGSRLNLWNKGYFHNPHTLFNNSPFPGGSTLSPGVQLLSGTSPDANPSYSNTPGLYIVWRASDDNAPAWANDSATANWVHTLFLGSTSFLGRSITGRGPVQDAGAAYAYQDCGINPVTCTPWVVSVGDSYISGEGGRWAGNTSLTATPATVDALGPTAYYDQAGTSENIPGCHRSSVAEIYFDDGTKGLNLACSGATTSTPPITTTGPFKPGLDFSSDSRGKGQALMLQEFAKSNPVKLVVVSIGGNDFNFGTVVKQCATDYISSLIPFSSPAFCNTDPSVTANFSAATVTMVTAAITTAIKNVRTAMVNAGYQDASYIILVQDYESPIPTTLRYDDGSITRATIAGCPFWNDDANWANTTALPTINGAIKNAVAMSGLTNIKFLELQSAFNGRRLCETGVGLLPGQGLQTYQDQGAVDKTEWINQIHITDTVGSYYQQESLHPNFWAQLALRNCVRQAYNGGTPRSGTCTINGPGLFPSPDGGLEPNMKFAAW